jgi:hypothetical protein
MPTKTSLSVIRMERPALAFVLGHHGGRSDEKPPPCFGPESEDFVRAVGLNPHTGEGKRSDSKRLKEQMRRLFRCHISFQASETDQQRGQGERWRDMAVAPDGELWWHPHPDQTALWESWIELGEKFFNAVIASPVPLDMRALRALKRSPLALDLYALIS